jgi:hypothetical protein
VWDQKAATGGCGENRRSCERRHFRYVARFGGRETPDTKTESKETHAASTSDITSCMATDPHTCRPIAFLLDSTDKTALQRCCVLRVRNSHRACQICFFSPSLGNRVCASLLLPTALYTVSFTGAGNKMTYCGEGVGCAVLYYNRPEASCGGVL